MSRRCRTAYIARRRVLEFDLLPLLTERQDDARLSS